MGFLQSVISNTEERFIDKPIRLIELFAGYGSQAMALRNIGANFEHHRVVEIDRYAIASYNAVHGTDFEPTDICEIHGDDLGIVDKDKYEYMLIYSFPCQSISVSGKRDGFEKGSGTASSLLWEVERLLNELSETDSLPQTLMMENVKALTYSENAGLFQVWIDYLTSIGYKTSWKILNTKDYGIPQNRERVFAISFLDKSRNYVFPQTIPLIHRLGDLLETEVPESFYYRGDNATRLIEELLSRYSIYDFQTVINTSSDGSAPTITAHYRKLGPRNIMSSHIAEPAVIERYPVDLSDNKPKIKEIANAIRAREDAGIQHKQSIGNGVMEVVIDDSHACYDDINIYDDIAPTLKSTCSCLKTVECSNVSDEFGGIKQIGNLYEAAWDNPQRGRVYSISGLSPTINTISGGNLTPFIVVAMRGRDMIDPSSRCKSDNIQQRLEINSSNCVNTITSFAKDSLILELPEDTDYQVFYIRLRKLTPRECLRLQGVCDDDIDKMYKVNSKSQLYKQAGNSITVNVLEALFKMMVKI